ncbi:cobalt/zinc/cadmium efflux RND transporter outermembrane protein [Oceanococcus atlanticus]|uniref:Cobalt/zinc/cadmium efflux RND transporter outermembrane protein n=1 Tax=Oceanococcus atlanticus TaxID=1317117 RepID=A0A1Y1SDV5_9GAMM|nr:TolC family protein [Oceanococcus atlanticus]ORE87186.1 cobalt/zinc/cadmium efflux RND transporter outermembrane protein [Oceanococcus atlanticus]
MFIPLIRGGALLLPSLLAVVAPSASAAEVSLASVLERTQAQHPSLRQIEALRLSRDPRHQAARFSPPKTVTLEFENVAGGGEFADAARLETSLSLGGVLEWPGKPDLRHAQVLSQTEVLALELDQRRRDVLANAASQYVEWAWYEARQALADKAVSLADTALQATQRRRQLGAASQADVQRARLALLDASQQQVQMQTLRDGARRALAMASGDTQWQPTHAAMNWSALPHPPAPADLRAQAEQAPLVAAAHAGYAQAEARLQHEVAQANPDLQWSLGVRHDRDSGDAALLAGFGIALGAARRSQPLQAALRQDLDAAGWAGQASVLDLGAKTAMAGAQLDSLRDEFYAVRDQLQPQAQALLDTTMKGYRDGRYSVLEMTSAQRELLRLEQRKLRIVKDFHQAWIELERVLGQALIQGAAS